MRALVLTSLPQGENPRCRRLGQAGSCLYTARVGSEGACCACGEQEGKRTVLLLGIGDGDALPLIAGKSIKFHRLQSPAHRQVLRTQEHKAAPSGFGPQGQVHSLLGSSLPLKAFWTWKDQSQETRHGHNSFVSSLSFPFKYAWTPGVYKIVLVTSERQESTDLYLSGVGTVSARHCVQLLEIKLRSSWIQRKCFTGWTNSELKYHICVAPPYNW